MSVNEKMTAIADAIRAKTGGTEPLNLDGMAAAVAGIGAGSGGDNTDRQVAALIDRSVTEFIIPGGTTAVGPYAFYNCTSLQTVSIPAGVTDIAMDAFRGCSSLQTVSIPVGVTSIGMDAFNGCSSLQTADMPEGVTSIGRNAFTGCKNLEITELPDSVEVLDGFNGASGIKLTRLPANLRVISDYSLYGTKISVKEIPVGVTSIGKLAMGYCPNISEITFLGMPDTIAANAFTASSNLVTINVPWEEGRIANAPWGAANATINYILT